MFEDRDDITPRFEPEIDFQGGSLERYTHADILGEHLAGTEDSDRAVDNISHVGRYKEDHGDLANKPPRFAVQRREDLRAAGVVGLTIAEINEPPIHLPIKDILSKVAVTGRKGVIIFYKDAGGINIKSVKKDDVRTRYLIF